MAEHLDKDPKSYADEYNSFCRELKSFHDQRGTAFNKLPRLNGHDVDLYLLYSLVTSRGGWEKVNINGEWESLLPYFGVHRLCANGPIALKQIYIRYLDVYERVHFLGEEVDRRELEHHEEDDARNRRKALRLLHATPTSYNASQHVVPDHVRSSAGLSTDGIHVTPTERVFLSLLCPLPNEQDFAINVCSLLAMESRKPFPLHQCPRIVDALLAHAGVFSQVDIRDLFTESYDKFRGQNLGRFWRDVVHDTDIVQLSEEDLVSRPEDDTTYWAECHSVGDGGEEDDPPMPMESHSDAALALDGSAPAPPKVNLVVRPLGSVRVIKPVISVDKLDSSLMEDESQSSVVLYENGCATGPLSASGSDVVSAASPSGGGDRAASCEPNFRNCLAKSTTELDRDDKSFPSATDHRSSAIEPSDLPFANGAVSSLVEHAVDLSTEDTDCQIQGETTCDGLAPEPEAVAMPDMEPLTNQSTVETNIERKVVVPKNRLPVAVHKPDNPRAVRYWIQQRRSSAAKHVAPFAKVEESQPVVIEPQPEDDDLFHIGRQQGVHDALGQRVLQVLNVVRNLSFDDANSTVLAQSDACMRLLLLAAHAKWSCLPQLAFDALSNMAQEINLKDPADCSLSAILLGTITRGLESSDRFILLRCMETLGRLAQRGENELVLLSSLDSHVFERLSSYLTIPDVALLIYTLECVYALSSLGQTTCNAFLHCQGTLDVLISLLTVEAQSYGSKARILMNVVETIAESEVVASTHAQLNPVQFTMTRPAHANSPAPSAPSTPPPMQLQPVAVAAAASVSTPVPGSPTSFNKIIPKTNSNSRPNTPTPSKTVVVPAISHTEKEQIAMQWLRSAFESVVGVPSIEQNVLYKQYTASCSRNGPKQVLGIVQFFSCVRATFGQNVGPFRKQVGTGVEFYFEGMSPKNSTVATSSSSQSTISAAPSPPNATAPNPLEVPGSPILKAQLCAPPKVNNRKEAPKQLLAHPPLSQALGQGVQSSPETNQVGTASGAPTSSLIKSLLANKVPDSNSQSANHAAQPPLGLSATATALPGMTRVVPCMNSHGSSVPSNHNLNPPSGPISQQQQVAQRQQQQRLLQQQQPVTNGPCREVKPAQTPVNAIKVNGVCSEMENVEADGGNGKTGGKGMLADLLEREVKKEPVNGGTPSKGKELRISDNGLELVQNEGGGGAGRGSRFAVDMGMVGMNDLGVGDLGDGAAAPKAAHLIAQVDDSGHVQIHLEEEAGSVGALCNGQSLLDQLEACEVSSSTDHPKATKRPADVVESSDAPPVKKPSNPTVNHVSSQLNDNAGGASGVGGANILEKAIEMTLATDSSAADKTKEKIINGNVNGLGESGANSAVSVTSAAVLPANQPTALQPPAAVNAAAVLGPNAPRTFLILQQQSPQQARLGFPQQGQRLLLAIQRPGGVIQHVAMPANVVAITSSQLQTNGAVMTVTNSTAVGATGSAPLSTSSSGHLPTSTVFVNTSAQPITTVATTVSSVVTTASMEGVVTFSGGAVAFPARPTENTSRTLAESHVTITPVPASAVAQPAPAVSAAATVAVASAATVTAGSPAVKKRTNSSEPVKPRGRPVKSKSVDGNPAVSSPSPQPVDPSLQFLCEWKDCMRSFKTPHEVYVHACHVHCPAHVEELGCLWERCDGLKRRRFSMMTHLMDRHCNDEMQKLLAARRHQMVTQGKTDIPPPQAPTPHPGYAPHAALHAIKRHAVELMNQKEQEEKEGPVTKSIRLTSALILRNIATHSALGRRSLQRYENHLASVALSNVESSRTVAQILYELTHQCS